MFIAFDNEHLKSIFWLRKRKLMRMKILMRKLMRMAAPEIRAFKSEFAIHSNLAEREANPDETTDEHIISGLTRLLCLLTLLFSFPQLKLVFFLNSQKKY